MRQAAGCRQRQLRHTQAAAGGGCTTSHAFSLTAVTLTPALPLLHANRSIHAAPPTCASESPNECAGSVETTSVVCPACANRTARLAARLVLPTPPLPDTMMYLRSVPAHSSSKGVSPVTTSAAAAATGAARRQGGAAAAGGGTTTAWRLPACKQRRS